MFYLRAWAIISNVMSMSVTEISLLWSKTLERVKTKLSDKHLFDSFLSDSYIHQIEGENALVVVNGGLGVTLLSSPKYMSLISECLNEFAPSNLVIHFIAKENVTTTKNNGGDVQIEDAPTYFKTSRINEKLTFDNFVVGECNRSAYQASIAVASNPGSMFNPLFIYSQPGLGKTHLLHAVGNYFKENFPAKRTLYISAEDFFDEYVKYVRGNIEELKINDFFKSIDVLLLDDIQFLATKKKTQDYFFTCFQTLYNAGKQIIITADKQPSELEGMEMRLVSRFGAGLTIAINQPDAETNKEIMKRHMAASGIDISRFDEEVFVFFAKKFSKNIRELDGAINKLIFYTMTNNKSGYIDLDTALNAVQDTLKSKERATRLDEDKIVEVVAEYYNLSPSQLTGKLRTAQVALARHIAMYLIRTLLDLPLTKIGEVFGGKDHTTVMTAVKNVEKGLKNDVSTQTAINDLKKRLKR